jgi:hypothetical protein
MKISFKAVASNLREILHQQKFSAIVQSMVAQDL